jgi:hypothetical protein
MKIKVRNRFQIQHRLILMILLILNPKIFSEITEMLHDKRLTPIFPNSTQLTRAHGNGYHYTLVFLFFFSPIYSSAMTYIYCIYRSKGLKSKK